MQGHTAVCAGACDLSVRAYSRFCTPGRRRGCHLDAFLMHSSFSACGQGAADIVQQPRTHRRASLHSAHRPFRAHVISQSGLAEQQPQEQTGAGSQQVQSPQIAQSAPDSAQQQEWMLQAAEDPAAWQPLMAAVPVLVPSGLAKATRLSKPGRAKAGRPPARPKRTSKGAQPDPGAAPKEPPDAERVEPEQTGTQPPASVDPQAVLQGARPKEEPTAVSIEEQAALRATYPWLFSDVSDSDTDTLQHRLSFARLVGVCPVPAKASKTTRGLAARNSALYCASLACILCVCVCVCVLCVCVSVCSFVAHALC